LYAKKSSLIVHLQRLILFFFIILFSNNSFDKHIVIGIECTKHNHLTQRQIDYRSTSDLLRKKRIC